MFSQRTSWNLATNRYSKALAQHRQSGRELLDLTASNPTTIGLTYREGEISRALSQRNVFTYEPIARGLLSARQAIAGYYAEKGSAVDPEALNRACPGFFSVVGCKIETREVPHGAPEDGETKPNHPGHRNPLYQSHDQGCHNDDHHRART